MPRTQQVPPRQPIQHEDEPLDRAELCVRVMERFFGAVEDSGDPKMRAAYIDLYSLFLDVLQEELAPYAADLAYALFSANEIAKQRRSGPKD